MNEWMSSVLLAAFHSIISFTKSFSLAHILTAPSKGGSIVIRKRSMLALFTR